VAPVSDIFLVGHAFAGDATGMAADDF